MRTATVNEIKQELINTPPAKVTELCLRLVKFKKENKELLTFLLFEAHDEQGYIESVKKEMDEQFEVVNKTNLYFAKKTIRKVLRTANKHIRYTGSKQVEVELLIYFCRIIKESKIPFHKSSALTNLFNNQIKKITTAINAMHEDLQYDYIKELNELAN
jgi:hypothetical protein